MNAPGGQEFECREILAEGKAMPNKGLLSEACDTKRLFGR